MNSPTSNRAIAPSSSETNLDERINRALEQKPEPQIPANFAARVAARAVAQPQRRRRSVPQFGKLMALLCAVFAGIALFALAPHTAPNLRNFGFDAEVLLLAELALIGGWLSRLFLPSSTR